MKTKTLLMLFIGLTLLVGCGSPATPAPPVATLTPTLFIATPTFLLTPGGITPPPGATAGPNPSTICTDAQSTALIDSFKTAILNSDGPQLSLLVSPARGMDVARFRDGTVITYTPQHAKFLFETTFEVDWGTAPGSGEAVRGPFHNVIVPELEKVFSQSYTLHCNELKLGGATYQAEWPYQGEYYSVHFPGTPANGNMDWYTWVMGIEYVSGKPYIYALIPFFWEP
ncbi:MAG TPA: hypothetical protein VK897_05460 [Anaerolineales bacterium]|nr:hypothetical protein [Anaerolineales bacterium]